MAGKIIADTLEHSTAGSIATNYVVKGSAKAWINFNGTGTVTIRDSLNVSALNDSGTGNYYYNPTNNLSSANYTRLVSAGSSGVRRVADTGAAASNTASAVIVITEDLAGSLADVDDANGQVYGDLA